MTSTPGNTVFIGATAGTNGTTGLVPLPTAGEQTLFLRGDATWAAGGGGGGGNVTGPGSSTNGDIVTFNGASGTAIMDSGVNLLAGAMTGLSALTTTSLTATTNFTFGAGTGALSASGGTVSVGTLPVSDGGTGTTSFTAGSVIFSNGTTLAQDNANLNWNDSTYTLAVTQPSSLGTLDTVLKVTSDPSGSHGHGNHIEIAGNPGGGGTIFRTDGGLNKSVLQLYGGDYTGTTGGAIYLNGNNSTSGDAGGVQTTFGLSSSTFDMYDNTQSVLLFQVTNSGVLKLPQLGANSYIGTDGSSNIVVKSAPGGFPWTSVAGTSQALVANNGYFAANAGLTTFTLPAAAAIGDTYIVSADGAGLFIVAQNVLQSIRYGNQVTEVGTGGNITATSQGDTLTIVCKVVNTGFQVINSEGMLNVT